MKKFIINKESFQIWKMPRGKSLKDLEDLKTAAMTGNREPQEIARFDTLEEARKAFENYKSNIKPVEYEHHNVDIAMFDILTIEEFEYTEDEDDDYREFVDMWDSYICGE